MKLSTAACLLMTAVLGACTSVQPSPQSTRPAASSASMSKTPAAGAMTPSIMLSADAASVNTPAPDPHSGVYAFEAERAAQALGCQGPDRSRPESVLRARREGAEWYEIRCAAPQRILKVRCDQGNCRVIQ